MVRKYPSHLADWNIPADAFQAFMNCCEKAIAVSSNVLDTKIIILHKCLNPWLPRLLFVLRLLHFRFPRRLFW